MIWITMRRTHNGGLIIGKSSLTEGILTVTLLEDSFLANCFGCQKTKGRVLEDRSITIRLAVETVFMISEDHNT
jgi:hypothetical protein